MSWIGEKHQTLVSDDKNEVEEEATAAAEEEYEKKNGNGVTSHVYIKPTHTCRSLDKEVVLRRIRQRKRVHKVRAAFQALLTSPFSANSNTHHKRWIDDAFAAL